MRTCAKSEGFVSWYERTQNLSTSWGFTLHRIYLYSTLPSGSIIFVIVCAYYPSHTMDKGYVLHTRTPTALWHNGPLLAALNCIRQGYDCTLPRTRFPTPPNTFNVYKRVGKCWKVKVSCLRTVSSMCKYIYIYKWAELPNCINWPYQSISADIYRQNSGSCPRLPRVRSRCLAWSHIGPGTHEPKQHDGTPSRVHQQTTGWRVDVRTNHRCTR